MLNSVLNLESATQRTYSKPRNLLFPNNSFYQFVKTLTLLTYARYDGQQQHGI